MDRQWDKLPRALSPPRIACQHASFSAALLDAIYQSIDSSPGKQLDTKTSLPDISRAPPAEFWREPRAALTNQTPQKYPLTPRYLISSSSTPRNRPPRPNRVQPDPFPHFPPNEVEAEVEFQPKNGNKKGKKKRSIMRLLKSLFSPKRTKKAKSQLVQSPQLTTLASTETVQPISLSAKSCMSSGKRLEGSKRSVRFAPVSEVVDEECKPCGQKCLFDGGVERQVDDLIKALKAEEKGRRKGSSRSGIGYELSEHYSLVADSCEDVH